VCLIGGIVILAAIVLYGLPLNQNYPGIVFLFFIVLGIPSVAFLIIGGLLLWQYIAESRLHLALYQQGVAVDRLNSHGVFTWDDLAAIKNGISRKLYRYEIVPKQGPHFVLTDRFSNGIMIGDAILRLFTNAQFPTSQQALKMGKTLSFGPITLSQAGISRGNQIILWPDLDISQNDALGFTIRSRRTGRQWHFPALAVPNRPLIVVLAMTAHAP
jgi:hypothetical protein